MIVKYKITFPHLSTLIGQVNEPVNRFIHHILPGFEEETKADLVWELGQLSYKPMSYGTAPLKTRLKLGLGIQFKKKREGEELKLGSLLKKRTETQRHTYARTISDVKITTTLIQ